MKSFTSGFESIFGVSAEEIELGIAEDQVDVLPIEKVEEESTDEETPRRRRKYRRRVKTPPTTDTRATGKNFTSDLESLFRDALTDTIEETIVEESLTLPMETPSEETISPRKTIQRKRLSSPGGSGLDLLIRQTTDETILEYKSDTKRVSFVFDKEKLRKLKRIAKERDLFLKDVLSEVVSNFIREYENAHGKMQL